MAKQELLAAVGEGNHDAFLIIIHNHGSKRSTLDLGEVLLELSRPQKEKIWTALHSWTDDQLSKLVGQNDVEGEVENCQPPQVAAEDVGDGVQQSRPNREIPESGESEAQIHQDPLPQEPSEPYNAKLMVGILEFACIYLKSFDEKEIFIPDKLLEFVVLLHGMVTVFEGPVQAGVLSLCELWWLKQLAECEHLIGNILPILLDVATSKTARKRDVIRLWTLNETLQLYDLSSSESESLVKQLVACSASTVFLNCNEGIKWLAALFSWQFLVPLLHQRIKSVLPGSTRFQSAKYAEVYFRAWKNSKGDVKKALEEDCIQDLMYAAVHVDPTSGRLSANLHHFLHHIHRHKRHYAVATTICSLYEPFLWRSLKAANGLVRMNTTGLLCDAFPLMDSSLCQEERGKLYEKQYRAIITLLTDPCHLVRITAIKGVFSILGDYWLMIPSDIIKTIFQKLLSDLMYDASSAEVRTQVIKGLTLLLDSRDAVPFLIEVLPRLADAFDDISLNVRVAFVKLLLKVKSSKVFRYWDIIPVNHLLHRLEEDKPVVCKLITQLILNSFYPVHREDEELMQRCLALLEENRAAARRFYRYVSRKLELNNIVHFMLLIWRCILNYVRARQAQDSSGNEENEVDDAANVEGQPVYAERGCRKRTVPRSRVLRSGQDGSSVTPDDKENTGQVPGTQRSQASTTVKDSEPGKGADSHSDDQTDDDEEEDEDDGGCSPLDNPVVIGGLFDTVVILWTTNAHKLAQSQNLKYLEALRSRLSKSMPLFFKHFKENSDVSLTLLYLSSFLPRTFVPTLVGHCMSRLRALQLDQAKEDTYVTYINALCNWNRADDVLELASEWLEEGLTSCSANSNKERHRSRCGVRFREVNAPQPLIALCLLRHIVQHPLNRLATVKRFRRMLLEIISNMDKVRDRIKDRLDQMDELSPLCSDIFLCECWSQYLSLVAVLHNPPVEGQVYSNPNEQDDDGESPEDLLFDSAENVSLCLDWADRTVVPVLAEDSGGGKKKRRARDDGMIIAISVLNDLMKTSTHLLMIGAVSTTFVYKLCSFVEGLLKIDSSGNFWQKSLLLALEAYQFLQAYDHLCDDEDDPEVTPITILKTCISSTSDYFKLQKILPENASEMHGTLVQVLTTLGQNSRRDQSEVMLHLAATIVEHLCWAVDETKGVDTEVTKIQDVGGCVALLVGVCQSRAKLSNALMDALTCLLTTTTHDITSLLATSYLLKILTSDSGKISRYCLKQTVVAADSLMSRIILPSAIDDDDDERMEVHGFYEQYSKYTKDLIQDLKSSLGVL